MEMLHTQVRLLPAWGFALTYPSWEAFLHEWALNPHAGRFTREGDYLLVAAGADFRGRRKTGGVWLTLMEESQYHPVTVYVHGVTRAFCQERLRPLLEQVNAATVRLHF